ncbi:AC4 protein [Hibiscus golden mosaic virus]|uniref:AC4 protein n=1 Tax=Hibiscus golden mosaic virus TaxID=2569569 RepID=A0A4D6FYE0_9GEMI|nr:AC4 protein [Hibiscus golden mosaic virus]QCB65767.1 AC4 protein [Hibiscus golden mosaic virus]
MESLISMCCFSSKGNYRRQIRDSSIWSPHQVQPSSMGTIREQSLAPTSSPTSTKTVMFSNGESSRSTVEVLEEVSRRLTSRMQRHSTQDQLQKHFEY